MPWKSFGAFALRKGFFKRFAPIFLRIEIKGGLDLGTKMISNIPQLANSGHGENHYFNAMARHVMNCLGEFKLADYSLFAGITGDIFTQVYRLNDDTVKAVSACDFYLGIRGIGSVFEKVGYNATAFSVRDMQANRDRFIQKIFASIDRGIPVIWYHPGMVGIIVGYENDSQSLLYVNGETKEPERIVIDDDFFKNKPNKNVYVGRNIDADGFVIMNEKKHDVSLKQIFRDAIMQMPKLLTMETNDYVFGAEAFRAWAADVEKGKFGNIKPDDWETDFFAYVAYVLTMSTNSGGSQEFLEKAQELNPDLTFLEEVRKQYRITNYLWNGGYYVKDVHTPDEREEMVERFGDYNLESLGGAWSVTLENMQDKEKCTLIAKQIRRFADCMDEVVRILKTNLPDK
jgi:hypothetical protein